ncbi:MAG: hypothetical protein AAB332_08095 [Planctomycetota bacterium]
MHSKKATYAGIGSRETHSAMMGKMEQLGKSLAEQGLVLRTGNCSGADQAFQRGANSVNPKLVELCLPWPSYEAASIRLGNAVHTPSRQAYEIAAQYHPAWHNCTKTMQALHARNVQIVLGPRLDQPVEFVLCWTPKGKAVGGTALGIRLALAYGIAVRNLANEESAKPVLCQAGFGW